MLSVRSLLVGILPPHTPPRRKKPRPEIISRRGVPCNPCSGRAFSLNYERRRRAISPRTDPAAMMPNATLDGSGTTWRKPRISPPVKEDVWIFRYAFPSENEENRAACALEGVPPLAVMNPARYELASVISKVWSYEPEVTPEGNTGKEGVGVATPAVPVPATVVAEWI